MVGAPFSAEAMATNAMSLTNVEDIYPLSPLQEALLPPQAAEVSIVGQCAQLSAVLTGRLDPGAFEWAWQQVFNRHAILRTSFVWERIDKPLQLVMRQLTISLASHDWRALAVEQQQEQISELLLAEQGGGINPAKAPLMRIVLCRMSDQVNHLICTYHRLILDDRSLFLILEEVLTFYESFGNGRNPQLAPSCPYWTYVTWATQKHVVDPGSSRPQPLTSSNQRTSLAERYLQHSLGDQADAYGEEFLELSTATVNAARDLAASWLIRFETLIQGAWVLLLNRESDEDKICFGLMVADCPAELNDNGTIVGPLTKILPVRVQVPHNVAAGGWLKELDLYLAELRQFVHFEGARQWSSAAFAEQPFESVFFDGEELPHERVRLSGAGLRIENIRAKSPDETGLVVKLRRGPACALQVSYDRRRFAPETIQRMLAHFQTLLDGIIAEPDCLILNLPFLTTAEEAQVLGRWNQTATDYPRESCIHELFEQQAQDCPGAIAAVYEDEQITYGELNRRANQLAHHLQLLGVQPENRIALCVERSLAMLVGILGILKAGAAYAPLDPAHPLKRLAFMLEDLHAPVVLTEERLLDRLPVHWAQVVCLDSDWATIALQSQENPSSGATAENLAYVMYTSGSTGTPKGVSVSHRAVVRLVKETNYAELSCQEVWLQFAPLSFDASTLEIWGSLLNGGRLAVMPALLSSLDSLGQALKKHEVTTLWLTAGLFHVMVDERLSDLRSIRQLLAGGDSLSVPHVRKAFEALPQCRLINGYGPTEGTTFTCCYPVVDIEQVRATVPIGRPVSNTRVFVLDHHLRAVPPGATGELYIAGDGLARDYHNRPMLTAERFVPNPYSEAPGARLYRTGDLVRYLPDGNIDFIGRRDLQVKVRGFRIELGEIESALSAHPSVQEVAVIARADMPGEKQLVAYLITSKQTSVSEHELRDFLRQKLPDHMIPAAFVMLEALPLTLNGKVDRQALPAPGGNRTGLAEDFVVPRTPAEEVLAAIWSQALGVDQVGIDDNFFSLGGDSIRSVQVLARAQERGLTFSLQDLFQYQTIRELTQIINTAEQGSELPEATQPFSLISEVDLLNLPDDIEDAYPLAMLQAGMIFHSELNPETAVYHDIFSHQLRAPYNPDALRTVFATLIQRHAVLRTGFAIQGFSEPLQLVHRTVPLPLQVSDLSDLAPAEQDRFLRNLVESEKKRIFEWGCAPLINLQIHRRSRDTFQFTLSFHHAILDGWSLASLLTELFQLYSALLDHDAQAPEPAPLAGSYRDYVGMEIKALASAECRRYWSDKLQGSSITRLPQRSSSQSKSGDSAQVHRVAVPISTEVSDGLKKLGRSASVPIKSVLLAAHLKVMSFISGQSDIITGLTANGRPEQGDGERLLGLFLNTIPLRQHLRSGPWIELVQQTFQNEWQALPFRWFPLAQIQREHGGQSLFETAFNFTHFHVAQAMQGRGNIEVLDSISFERTNWPLLANFSLDLSSSDIRAVLVTDAARFTNQETEIIAGYYFKALMSMATEPEGNHQSTSLLSDSELQQFLQEWNSPIVDYSRHESLPQLFEKQAARIPDHTAVTCEGRTLTYAELNTRANQLAHYLRRHGVGAEVLVGLCVERSVEMIVGLLGILKAGGAYLPLDPSYPRDRLAFMIEDARLRVIVAQDRVRESLGEQSADVVSLDSDWERIAREERNNPTAQTEPENSAYVIYTSGSTGRPKGVTITHRNVLRLFESTEGYFNFGADDVWTLFHSYAFDFSVWEIWGALLYGGKLIVAPYWVSRSPEAFYRLLVEEGVTVLNQTPSAFRQLEAIDASEGAELRLRLIIFGGEALELELLRPWYERHGDQKPQLVNMYGITETTVHVTYRALRMADLGGRSVIGRALPDLKVCVLDEYLGLVPAGVAGELYVGGAGVGRGYLHRAQLTAERFIADPFSAQAGARLYKTGDVARHLPNGELEYLGRVDEQVKIRGFRVELGEISATLADHPAVRENVVTVCGEGSEDSRLVAYVVLAPGSAISAVELRETLSARLPDYMVPTSFVFLDALPLTPSGKVDRRSLPPADTMAAPVSDAPPVPPRTEIEQLLHSVWSAVLKVDGFGIHDNFFALGGHSLLATRIVARLRTALQMPVPLRELFVHPTVAELARWVETAMREENVTMPAMQRVTRSRPLPLSFAQQRLWFIDQLAPGTALYNMPMAMRLHGNVDVTVLERVLSEIIRRHEVLRTSFEMAGYQPVQVIAPAQPMRLPVEDLRELELSRREEIAAQLVREDSHQPFDLSCGPMLRARLLRLDEEEYVVLLTMHHIVTDGWSRAVLLREVATLYRAFVVGEPSPLPELEIQYADYAVWQRRWLQGEELERQISYWREQLKGAPSVLRLPLDHPRPAVQTHQGAHYRFRLDPEVSRRLKQVSREAGVTMFMLLLTAWEVLLHRLSGAEDICIGTAVAGRNHAEVDLLIGFFVNTLVLRVDLGGDPTFGELLERVREKCVAAYGHQDVPFEKLVEELAPERSMSHSPLFQVMLVMQQESDAAEQLEGLAVSGAGGEVASAKYDLTLHLHESGGVLNGELEYNTDIFVAESARRMVEQWERVLAAGVEDPKRRLSELPLLSDDERTRIVAEWNETAVEYEAGKALPELFEDQVQHSPEAIALVYKDEEISYLELNRRANQLARHLRKLGVGPERLVGVCVERSVEMAVALIGILKAGGAYVPLDPEYPRDRLSFMLADAQPAVLLTQERLVSTLPQPSSQTLCIDRDWPLIALESDADLETTVCDDNLAYVIYTSGSTGQPKGVQISQRALTNLLCSIRQEPGFEGNDVLLAVTTLSFDIAGLELYLPLICGGRVVIVSRDVAANPKALKAAIAQADATFMQATPATWKMLIDAGWQGTERLKILCGGEALSARLAEELLQRCGALWNMYGPTETTVYSTLCKITSDAERILIGRPIANTKIYLLDSKLNPVPIGASGNLCIGGGGLARGYLNRPELTAERFIPNPFVNNSQERIYQTGDLGRYLPDGRIECLGRVDNQVKIRGFRVELGEIESVLREHESVREAVAIVQQAGEETRLAAFVVSAGAKLTAVELRLYVKGKLPEYMVPSVLVLLDQLPLTLNGKVDRRALVAQAQPGLRPEEVFVAPRDVLEFRLAQIWEEVLDVRPIGMKDNFFELGGHSLLAVRLIARISEETGRALPLASLIQGATIESLANLIRQQGEPSAPSPLVAIRREGVGPAFFCVHPAGGNVLCYAALAQHLGPGRPFYGLQARGLEDGEEPFTSVEAAAAHYVEAIRAIQPEGPYLVGGWSTGGLIAFEMVRLLQEQRQQIALLALFDSRLVYEKQVEEDDATLLINAGLHLGLPWEHVSSLREGIRPLKGDEQLNYALDHIRRLNLVPPGVEADQIHALIRVLKANLQAARSYAPRAGNARVTLFQASNPPFGSAGSAADLAADWLSVALDGVEVREIPGDHFAIMREPHVKVLADQLNECLLRALDGTHV